MKMKKTKQEPYAFAVFLRNDKTETGYISDKYTKLTDKNLRVKFEGSNGNIYYPKVIELINIFPL